MPTHKLNNHSVIIKNSLIQNIDFDFNNNVPSGQFIGISKFTNSSVNLFKKALDTFEQNDDLNGEFVRLIQFLLKEIDLYAFFIKDKIWINVNNKEKFNLAQNIFG